MKAKLFVRTALIMLGAGCSLTSWGQVNSATMYNGGSNNPGSTGSYYGRYSSATGLYSFGGGYDSDATGHYSMALGTRNKAIGPASLALGIDVRGTGDRSMVIGSGYSISSPLTNSLANSLMVGFKSDKPTLYVGSASGPGTVGNVGIGTSYVPIARLKVSNLTTDDWYYGIKSEVNNDETKALAVTDYATGEDLFLVWGSGIVNTKKLYSEEIQVISDAIGISWPDYVFSADYELRPLREVKSFINVNHHLPDVPSQQEILDGGINLGEMDAVLLRKIEELTLYVLELQEEIDALKGIGNGTEK